MVFPWVIHHLPLPSQGGLLLPRGGRVGLVELRRQLRGAAGSDAANTGAGQLVLEGQAAVAEEAPASRPPSDVCWFLSPSNYSYISTINHSEIGVINQLSYLGGLTL